MLGQAHVGYHCARAGPAQGPALDLIGSRVGPHLPAPYCMGNGRARAEPTQNPRGRDLGKPCHKSALCFIRQPAAGVRLSPAHAKRLGQWACPRRVRYGPAWALLIGNVARSVTICCPKSFHSEVSSVRTAWRLICDMLLRGHSTLSKAASITNIICSGLLRHTIFCRCRGGVPILFVTHL